MEFKVEDRLVSKENCGYTWDRSIVHHLELLVVEVEEDKVICKVINDHPHIRKAFSGFDTWSFPLDEVASADYYSNQERIKSELETAIEMLSVEGKNTKKRVQDKLKELIQAL